MAKRLIGSGCRSGCGEWGQSRMGVLDGVAVVDAEGAVLGVKLGIPL